MPLSPSAAAQAVRLLGLVFASADVAFEIDRDGRLGLALGAVEALTGRAERAIAGQPWTVLFTESEHALLADLRHGLAAGERRGPLRVALARPDGLARYAALSVFHMPDRGDGALSCALTAAAAGVGTEHPLTDTGLIAPEDFPALAASLLDEAAQAGLPVQLDLVELEGLDAAAAELGEAEGASLKRRVAAALRAEAYGGAGASEVAEDRYVLLRSAQADGGRLQDRLREVCGPTITPQAQSLALDGETAAQNLRAMRYALDRYIEDGASAAATSFAGQVQRTLRDTARFKATLANGAFHLAYQPIASLKDGSTHHHEALARFDANASPADTIRLAEELGLIADFDLAVVGLVARKLADGASGLKVAANVSGGSLAQPGFVERLLAATAFDPRVRPRLLIEVTETQALGDLDEANARLQALRESGHPICIDDFGAGAASLDYLRRLEVDFVKIDGRYVQGLETSPRDVAIVRHVLALCAELGVGAIVEMVESEAAARIARELGATLAQGFHIGRPNAEPVMAAKPPPPPPLPARRKGAVDDWR